jgi:anaerobic selenocysteine-containing dehydrogenase
MGMNGEPLLGATAPAVAPTGPTDVQIWAQVAGRLGIGRHFPWRDDREALDWRLEPSGLDTAALLCLPEGFVYAEQRPRAYLDDGFWTPSGKIELLSDRLAAAGHDPLPTGALRQSPADSDEYPLVLTSGSRVLAYVHSRFRTIAQLRRLDPRPTLECGPVTAAHQGVADGQMVALATRLGSIQVTVRVTDRLPDGVVHMPHGWAEPNVNLLSGSEVVDLDPVTGFPCFRSMPARLSPV